MGTNIMLIVLIYMIVTQSSAYLFNPETMYRLISQLLQTATGDSNENLCSKKLFEYTNSPANSSVFNTLFVATGKSVNDLGNYEKCQSMTGVLKYALVTIKSTEILR